MANNININTMHSDSFTVSFSNFPSISGVADLSIFDRWGVCIFKETNTTLGWDGKYKGQLCQQGIYVYQVNIKAMSGENTTKTGHVTLLSKLK